MTDQPTAESGAEGVPSIEDTLAATFDAIEARDSDPGEGETNSGEAPAETAEATADTDTAAEEAAETPDQDNAEGEGTAAEQPLSPPERWSAEDKAAFTGLPREAQNLVLKREADVQRYLTQESQKIADIKRNYEPLDRIIGPRREAWALSGFTTDTALEHLFALSDFATRDKPGFVRWFAQQHGVDLSDLASGGHEAPDPKITALEQRVQSFEQKEQQRQQQAAEQNRQTIQSAVEQFAADKSNSYYKDVENDIAAMLPGIVQQNPGASHKELLKIAYDRAVWANPDVRAKLQAEQKKAEDLAAAKAAEKAKKAAGTNVKTSGGLPDGRRKLTMDETMSETFDRITARA